MILLTEHIEGPGCVFGSRCWGLQEWQKTQNPSVSVAFPPTSGCKRHKAVSNATSILHPAVILMGVAQEYLHVRVLGPLCLGCTHPRL